jgi:aryl-alcohol dehydrogenase-like predicted oxidoreductase
VKEKEMKYRPLGRGGWEISEVGLGTYPLGGALQTVGSYWSGPVTYGAVSAEAAIATIRAGLAAGLNFIDTAPVYGDAETFIHQALRERPAVAARTRCHVATKCGEHVRQRPEGGPPELARDFSRTALRASLARSRERLGVDKLDLVFLHSPRLDELAEDPLGLLAELRERGEVECIGESVGSIERGVELVERAGRVDVLQIPFSILQPEASERLLPAAAERGVGIVVRQPLASGFLTGRIREDHVFAPDDYRSTIPRERIVERARQARGFGFLVEEGIAGNLPEAALRYVLSFPAVSSVIPGAMRPDELMQNMAVSDLGPLPPQGLSRIEAIQRGLGVVR